MPTIKISELLEKATMVGTEEVLINDSGTSRKFSTQRFLDVKTDAETAQAGAETAETNAATSATNASSSASTASTQATNAASSASAASTSETNAATSATNASTSATNAATSETNAATSATNAATSATNAAASETNAAASAASAAANATYENLNANGDIGTGATQVAQGDHAHAGVYEPADATILKDADIGVNVQAYSAILDATTASFTAADETKLDGIEAGATADQSASEIKTAYESNANTNAFTDADHSKLDGIETNATADQTASEILTAIKTVDGAGSGLDADLLDGNHSSAFATSGHNHSGVYQPYDADIPTVVVSQAEAEAGTSTAKRTFTPQRVKQAIDALASGGTLMGTTLTNVTSSRADNVTYTNSTGKMITVMFNTSRNSNCEYDIYINGSKMCDVHHDSSTQAFMTFLVPNGANYKVDFNHVSLSRWYELR